MEIVSSDDHDTFDDVEEDLDEDQNHITNFIATEHVSLTEELLQKHEAALKVRKTNKNGILTSQRCVISELKSHSSPIGL